ncbi:uncharacterized protein N7479_009938 [Penicillium vulpinum]|uniref:uncharacterized protein n=1 Tax=Penicillium vulpinum TaxID=29845 RepID=UPI0025471679|nr:uncharacterized protein N7479_009938 [Penicillium vulpinum]KAJ5951525.1 hypothetical protein N7479_009938 [Penicillium vulpinum]
MAMPDLDEEGQGLMSALSPSLLRNVNLKSTSLICSFDCGSPLQRERVIECVLQMNDNQFFVNKDDESQHSPKETVADRPQSSLMSGIDHIWGYTLPEGNQSCEITTENSKTQEIMPIFTSDWMFGSHLDYHARYPFLFSGPSGSIQADAGAQRTVHFEPLSFKTREILSLIKDAVTFAPRSSMIEIRWSSAIEEECRNFFAPSNILKFLELFWASWYPHWQVIHRPTFDLFSTKPTLLAAMILIGACVSPDTSHKESAKIWFDCIEEGAFSDDSLYRQTTGDPRSSRTPILDGPIMQAVQGLQTAYAICVLQNWEGSAQSKRRVPKFRYPVVTAVPTLILSKPVGKHLIGTNFIAHEVFKR